MSTDIERAPSHPPGDFAAPIEAIIYRPARSVMQAGMSKTRQWVLQFTPRDRTSPDPLMGWAGSGDTRRQVTLKFPTREAAEAYAQHAGLRCEVKAAGPSRLRTKSYAENFRADRLVPWSH